MDKLTPEEIKQEVLNTLTMVENELCFGGNWEDARARIGRCRSKLAKQDVCPECGGERKFFMSAANVFAGIPEDEYYDCPACQGKKQGGND